MRAMIVLALAASPLALAAPADAQSVIRDGKWVSGQPAPPPPPPPPSPVEEEAPIAPAPATVPDAAIVAPQAQPAPRFAPRAEVVQPVSAAPKPAVRSAAVPPPPPPSPAGEAAAMPPPPPPVARVEAAPGATYAPPARSVPPVSRADAPPPPPVRAAPRREALADAPPPPRPYQRERHADMRGPDAVPHHAATRPHRAHKHRWGEQRDGRWEGGWRAPGGWASYRRPSEGWTLPRYWWSPEFVVVDYWTYDLDAPFDGGRWVRYYDDAVLVDEYGRVAEWREDIDWDDAGGYYPDERDDGYYPDYAEDYGPDYAPVVGYPAGGYISGGYYYPPATTHTIRIDMAPVATTRTYVTEEVITTHTRKGGKDGQRSVQTKRCNC